jgi:hypothetical protein
MAAARAELSETMVWCTEYGPWLSIPVRQYIGRQTSRKSVPGAN